MSSARLPDGAVELPLLASSSALPPVSSVFSLPEGNTVNETLTTPLSGQDVAEPDASVSVSRTALLELSGMLSSGLGLEKEPHGGEAGTSSSENEGGDEEEDAPSG